MGVAKAAEIIFCFGMMGAAFVWGGGLSLFGL